MPATPYAFMVHILEWPLPAGVGRRFHYFRREKDAKRMVAALESGCRLEKLGWGPSFQRPVAYATLEHHGLFFETRHEFPYEATADDVAEAFLDKQMLGCDCNRSDLIINSTTSEDAARMERLECGNTIRLHSRVILWESDPEDWQLH